MASSPGCRAMRTWCSSGIGSRGCGIGSKGCWSQRRPALAHLTATRTPRTFAIIQRPTRPRSDAARLGGETVQAAQEPVGSAKSDLSGPVSLADPACPIPFPLESSPSRLVPPASAGWWPRLCRESDGSVLLCPRGNSTPQGRGWWIHREFVVERGLFRTAVARTLYRQ